MVKGVKARKKGRGKWNKTIGILLCITAMGTIITLSAWRQINLRPLPPPPPPKEPANEYFSFSEVIAVGEALEPDNSSIKVSTVGFNIKPVRGNATMVHIYPRQGELDPQDTPYYEKMINGTIYDVGPNGPIEYPLKVTTDYDPDEKGWPLLFQILCNEAEGDVIVYVTKFFPLPSSGS